jgi:hypothetical protein
MSNVHVVKTSLFVAFMASSFLVSCATHRPFVPDFSESPRQSLHLATPVTFAVLDARQHQEGSAELVQALLRGVQTTYPHGIQVGGYFDKAAPNSVLLRLRILALGADFGLRQVSEVAITNTIVKAQTVASPQWNDVIASAAASVVAVKMPLVEGYWVGSSWFDLDVTDTRSGRVETFTLPVAALATEPNLWGYRSARKAAEKSWQMVQQQLIRVIDKILITIRDHET